MSQEPDTLETKLAELKSLRDKRERLADAALDKARNVDAFKLLGWKPQPRQAEMERLSLVSDETLTGGSAGGGKTDWLVAHVAAHLLRTPGDRGVIFRRVTTSLSRTVLPRAVQLLMAHAKFNAQTNSFQFHNGSILDLAHLEHEHSVHRYQGTEYGVVGFEELTEFTQYQYEYMLSRVRSTVAGARPHVVATTNPGNVGHVWVKRRFVKPLDGDWAEESPDPLPNIVWRPRPVDGITQGSRVFVPAGLEDNAILRRLDPGYEARLLGLASDEGMRMALRYGDWNAIEKVEGALWTTDAINRSRVERAPEMVRVVVGVDPAMNDGPNADDTGIVAVGRGIDGHAYVLADKTCHLPADGWARRAVELAIEVEADQVVVEVNQGGAQNILLLRQAYNAMVAEGTVDRPIHIFSTWAKGSKRLRAAPVSMLWVGSEAAPPTAHMVGRHLELEQECTTWVPERTHQSPNRIDAMVHATAALRVVNATATHPEVLPPPRPGRPSPEAKKRAEARTKGRGSSVTWI